MKQELDELLCKKYPRMMVNRNKGMMETCMCWGFECGDGWYNILDQLMGNIQHHIDWKEKQRQWAIDFNSKAAPEEMRPVPDAIPQVTLDQVKEKFGSLRFYYTGGDDYISGMVTMAEAMTEVTCETCGKPGTQTKGGWIKTACEEHTR
jgi:ribosomal protein S27E